MRHLLWLISLLSIAVHGSEPRAGSSLSSLTSSPATAVSALEGQPQWPEGLPEFVQAGLRESNERQKPLFFDFYTDWCGPCKLMKHKTFPDPRVQAELKNWVVLRIDRDRYPRVAAAFSVSGLPTYLLFSEKGAVLDKVLGYHLAEDFAIWLTAAREKNTP